MQDRINEFLELNGWVFQEEHADAGEDYVVTFVNGDKIGIELWPHGDKEIVFIGDVGDVLHIPYNYYALVGALIECRQICICYKSVSNKPVEETTNE